MQTTATRHRFPRGPELLPTPREEKTARFLPALTCCLWLVFTCSANTPEQVSTFFTAKLCQEFLLRQPDPFQRERAAKFCFPHHPLQPSFPQQRNRVQAWPLKAHCALVASGDREEGAPLLSLKLCLPLLPGGLWAGGLSDVQTKWGWGIPGSVVGFPLSCLSLRRLLKTPSPGFSRSGKMLCFPIKAHS